MRGERRDTHVHARHQPITGAGWTCYLYAAGRARYDPFHRTQLAADELNAMPTGTNAWQVRPREGIRMATCLPVSRSVRRHLQPGGATWTPLPTTGRPPEANVQSARLRTMSEPASVRRYAATTMETRASELYVPAAGSRLRHSPARDSTRATSLSLDSRVPGPGRSADLGRRRPAMSSATRLQLSRVVGRAESPPRSSCSR
jgi:hypothetical protein